MLLIHGTTRRIESDSSQAEACECDRDLRAVVLRDGPLSKERFGWLLEGRGIGRLGYPFERSWAALPASNPSSTGPSRIAREKLAPDVRTPEKNHGGGAITGKASSRETVVLRLDGYPRLRLVAGSVRDSCY